MGGKEEMEIGLARNASPPGYGTSAGKDAPPSYEDGNVGPPPSYQSIYDKMKQAHKTSSTPVHFVGKATSVVMGTACATSCIAMMIGLPIAMVVNGAVHINKCPLERMIPIFMIVQGSVYIVKTIIDVAVRYYQSRKRCRGCQDDNNEEDDGHTKRGNWLSRLLGLFLFGFFIAGNVWVYSNYAPSNVEGDPRYCDHRIYYFAFWVITSSYIVLGLLLCCVCSCLVVGCTGACCFKAGECSAEMSQQGQSKEGPQSQTPDK